MRPKKITSAPSTSTTAPMMMQPVVVSFQQTAPTTLDNEGEEGGARTTIMTERPVVWTRRPASGKLVKGEVWHQIKHPGMSQEICA